MSIQATCDSCGRTYSLPEKYAGKRLPCKECGEVFEVQGEDDFDLPPSRPRRPPGGSRPRSAAPARASKKKGKRRRKSGPPWLLIGLGSAAGLLVVGGLIWAVVALIPHTHDSLAKAHLKAMDKMASILEGVTDTASAEAAVPKLEKLADHIAELYREGQRLRETEPLTMDENDALWDKYGDDRKQVEERMEAQMKRLRDIPEALAIVQKPIIDISRKIAEVRREERERKLEERGIKPPGDPLAGEARQAAEMERQAAERQRRAMEAAMARTQNPTQRPAGDAPGLSVRMPKVSNFDDISERLREMAGRPQLFGALDTAEGHTVNIAPVPDLDRFLSAVDFGNVSNVDRAARIVTIEPDESYVFKPGGSVAVD